MKKLLPICLILLALGSCVMNEELESMTPKETNRSITVDRSSPTPLSLLPAEALATIQIRLKNRLPRLVLEVESILLCNVHQTGTYHFPNEQTDGYWELHSHRSSMPIPFSPCRLAYQDSLTLPKEQGLPFLPQCLQAWNPRHHPSTSTDAYILMSCRIYQEDADVLIWGNANNGPAEVAIPLTLQLQPDECHTLTIALEDNCPWYSLNDSIPSRILQPITFDASVDDWDEISI